MDTKTLVKSIKTLDDGIINNIFSFMKMKSPWICSICEFNLEEHLHMKCAGCLIQFARNVLLMRNCVLRMQMN